MHVYIIMLIFSSPVGGTQTLKYGGSVTRFFLSGSLQISRDCLCVCSFPRVLLPALYVANDH